MPDRHRFSIGGLALLVFCSILVGLLPTDTTAGTGTIREQGGVKYADFCVSIRFNASTAEIDKIKQAFTGGNAVLADATDGQFAFGKVDIVNNSGASNEADVWILENSGRAFATCGSYGTPGTHITMYYPSNFGGSDANGNAYTVAHEFVHHLWGIKDEYSGPSGGGDCEATPGSSTANFCLMDNYFTRGGNMGTGTTYTLNELCVSSNHDPDGDTWQEASWSQSCWERIAAHPTRSGTAPGGLPTDGAPAVVTPTYRLPATDRRFVVCVDRSGSMASDDGGPATRLDLAKQSAEIFINLTDAGDRIGVTSFSSSASTQLNLTTIVNNVQRTQAINAVNGLSAGGSTNIREGLEESRDLLTAPSDRSCVQTIVLYTDGFHNVGADETTVIPSLQANDIKVIAIAVGGTTNDANLNQVACETGGRFFKVNSAADLPGLLAALSAEETGGGVLAQQPAMVGQGSTSETTAFVDAFTNEATFTLSWNNPNDDLDLTLVDPSGDVITPAQANADIEFITAAQTELFKIRGAALEVGTWTARVYGASVTGNGQHEVVVTSDTPEISFAIAFDKPSYVYPQKVKLMATPHFKGKRVIKAHVSGYYIRPDGGKGHIDLHDDGTMGDLEADDGVYTHVFDYFGGNGAYSFDLTASNFNGGTTFGGEALFAHVDPDVEDAPDFTRKIISAAIISGVPDNQPPEVSCDCPVEAECESHEGTEVVLTADVVDNDGDPLTVEWFVDGDLVETQNVPGGNPVTMATVQLEYTYPLGSHTVEVRATDDDGEVGSCETEVEIIDTTPPELHVGLNRDVLWPPNHKLVDISADVHVEDVCDPNPVWYLVSIESNEPDNGKGDGNTNNDIQGAGIGEADDEFQLRSERQGGGDGRKYTIVYVAEDASGNVTEVTVCVWVPHDKSGTAHASVGFAPGGGTIDDSYDRFALIISSWPDKYAMDINGNLLLIQKGFDATAIDPTRVYVGNTKGVVRPDEVVEIDVDGDGMKDLGLYYPTAAVLDLQSKLTGEEKNEAKLKSDASHGPIGIHYQGGDGTNYRVNDLFGMGEPIPLLPALPPIGFSGDDAPDVPKETEISSIYPNPFNPTTTVAFTLKESSAVVLRIYNARGALVRTLKNETLPSGRHQVQWNGRDEHGRQVATGVYFAQLTAGQLRSTKKLVMIK